MVMLLILHSHRNAKPQKANLLLFVQSLVFSVDHQLTPTYISLLLLCSISLSRMLKDVLFSLLQYQQAFPCGRAAANTITNWPATVMKFYAVQIYICGLHARE